MERLHSKQRTRRCGVRLGRKGGVGSMPAPKSRKSVFTEGYWYDGFGRIRFAWLHRAMKIRDALEMIARLRLIEDRLLCRIVVQVWSQPSLDFVNAHPFAIGIVGDLIAADLPQAEVTRFRMGKVKTTHA